MSDRMTSPPCEGEFIRLFFPAPVEEEIAARWARRLAILVGPRIKELRPETTFAEILEWAATNNADTTDFLVVFEPELRMALAVFLDDAEDLTFRQMVQHVGKQFSSVGCNQNLSNNTSQKFDRS